MLKLHYAAGFAFLALSGSAVVAASRRAGHPVDATPMPDPIADYRGPAVGWFRLVKPYCNTVEAETVIGQHAPPEGLDGLGYAAACFALAGRIERAREYLLRADPAERWQAAGIVFEVGHPVADAGDDRSAGPIMELVVEFWPNHYMAQYHAGAAAFGLGRRDSARKHLESFLRDYTTQDGWRSSARGMLDRLGQ
ncbi:MAG: hypothetical protein AB7R55_02545 [Gemmatimonadales bacterium]